MYCEVSYLYIGLLTQLSYLTYVGFLNIPPQTQGVIFNVAFEFGYKPVCSQLTITHYVSTTKIIHVYFSHMTYLMSHVTSLNNTHRWFYKLPHSGL